MPLQFKTCGRVIHAHQQMMSFNNEIIKIRPKTFSLLLMFVKNPYTVLSKQLLLDTVWDDVEVTEQVLFQTIRELRNFFKNEDVIKTHPRKGYAWITCVEKITEESPKQTPEQSHETSSGKKIQQSNKPTVEQENNGAAITEKPKAFPWQQLLIFIVFCIVTLLFTTNNTSTTTGSSLVRALEGSLVILPVKSTINDNDHQWVNLGAMDQLISRLKSNNKLVVLSTDYVLTVMKEADLPTNYSTKNIRRIFEVSGASLIVETELSGSTYNYQLKYTFHFKDDIKRGVIFEHNIHEALIQLTSKITAYTDQSINELDKEFISEFGSEMLVRALDSKKEGDYLTASTLLESLIQLETNNIVARRLLADIYLRLRNASKAKQHIVNAIDLAKKQNSAELPKLYYYLGLIELIQDNIEPAFDLLIIANDYAVEKNDWLYLAFIAQLMGNIHVNKENFDLADASFKSALKYHDVIQCPIGTSNTLFQLNNLANIQGNKQLAEQYLNRASQIIHDRNLTFMMDRLKKVEDLTL